MDKMQLPEGAVVAIKAMIKQENQRQQIATQEIGQAVRFVALGSGLITVEDKFTFDPVDFTIEKENTQCENKTLQTSDTSTKKK